MREQDYRREHPFWRTAWIAGVIFVLVVSWGWFTVRAEEPEATGETVRPCCCGQGAPSDCGHGRGPGPGPSPCQDKVIMMTSEADGFTNCPGGRPDSGTSMKSWRDF